MLLIRVKMCDLTHWSRVTHISVNKTTNIGSDYGLSPDRCQAIIWTNAGILLIGHLGKNFRGILIVIHTFSNKKMHLKMPFGKWRPFCLGLNVFKSVDHYRHCPCSSRCYNPYNPMSLKRGPIYHESVWTTAMTAFANLEYFRLTKDTS